MATATPHPCNVTPIGFGAARAIPSSETFVGGTVAGGGLGLAGWDASGCCLKT